MAERVRSQLQPRAGPRGLEPTSKVDGHDTAYEGSPGVHAPPTQVTADALDVGEQIRRLQALAELRANDTLTDGELTDLKRRVLSSGSEAPREARHAGNMQARHSVVSGRGLDRREPRGSYVTALEVVGTIPVTCRVGAHKRPSYVSWKKALHAASAKAAAAAQPTSGKLFSLQIELRLYAPGGPGSDLDNYVKPIQDALAERGIFGPARHKKSPMKGDEHVDHLEVRRRRVSSEAEAGVLAEVWALET